MNKENLLYIIANRN